MKRKRRQATEWEKICEKCQEIYIYMYVLYMVGRLGDSA